MQDTRLLTEQEFLALPRPKESEVDQRDKRIRLPFTVFLLSEPPVVKGLKRHKYQLTVERTFKDYELQR